MSRRNNRKLFTDAFITTVEASLVLSARLAKKLDQMSDSEVEEFGIDCAAEWIDCIVGEDNPIKIDWQEAIDPLPKNVARA